MKTTKKEKKKGKEKEEQTRPGNSKWSKADEALLVETMAEQKAGTGWGDNNPKPIVWTACELVLAGSKKISGGAPKTIGVLKSRWQKVCPDYVHVCAYLTICSSKRNMILSRNYGVYQDSAGMKQRSRSMHFCLYGMNTSRYI